MVVKVHVVAKIGMEEMEVQLGADAFEVEHGRHYTCLRAFGNTYKALENQHGGACVRAGARSVAHDADFPCAAQGQRLHGPGCCCRGPLGKCFFERQLVRRAGVRACRLRLRPFAGTGDSADIVVGVSLPRQVEVCVGVVCGSHACGYKLLAAKDIAIDVIAQLCRVYVEAVEALGRRGPRQQGIAVVARSGCERCRGHGVVLAAKCRGVGRQAFALVVDGHEAVGVRPCLGFAIGPRVGFAGTGIGNGVCRRDVAAAINIDGRQGCEGIATGRGRRGFEIEAHAHALGCGHDVGYRCRAGTVDFAGQVEEAEGFESLEGAEHGCAPCGYVDTIKVGARCRRREPVEASVVAAESRRLEICVAV